MRFSLWHDSQDQDEIKSGLKTTVFSILNRTSQSESEGALKLKKSQSPHETDETSANFSGRLQSICRNPSVPPDRFCKKSDI